MIAVTFALPAESSAFVRLLKTGKRDKAIIRGKVQCPSVQSGLADPPQYSMFDVSVVHTGVGAAKCVERLADFLANEKPARLIATGFCGATNDALQPGDLVIAENASNLELLQKAREILSRAKVGKIHSASGIIDPTADRYAVGRKHSAVAVDMETETIARLCEANSIPMLALRVVSDSPAAPFPAPPNVLFDIEKQRTNFSQLLSYIARNPSSAIRLAQFSKQIARAKAKLAAALIAVLGSL